MADPERFQRWFSAADLPANQAGHLAPDQARRLGLEAKAQRGLVWIIGLVLFVGAIAVAYFKLTDSASFAPAVSQATALIGAAIVGLIGIVFTAVGFRGRFSRQVATGAVEHVTGPAHPRAEERSGSGESHYTVYSLRIGAAFALEFEIDRDLYHAISDGEPLTAYFLAGARRLVNLEPAAPPVQGAAGQPAMPATVAGPADGAPLAPSVIGRWRMAGGPDSGGMGMIVEFGSDGTLVMTPDLGDGTLLAGLSGGMRTAMEPLDRARTMRYAWVDADHMRIEGQAGSGQVRLSGGQLVVDIEGQEQHLVRLADAPATRTPEVQA